MAKIIKSPYGKVIGKLGDVVGKVRKGKHYLALAPVTKPVTTNPKLISLNKRFATAVAMASGIKDEPTLKKLWSIGKPSNLSRLNFIIKRNYEYITGNGPSDVYQLAPTQGGFNISYSESQMVGEVLELKINPLLNTSFFDYEREVKLKAIVVDYMSKPNSSHFNYEFVDLLSGNEIDFTQTEELKFEVKYTGTKISHMNIYSYKKRFGAIFTLDKEGNYVQYSKTFCIY